MQCDLHWLPNRQRISFRLAMIVFKCLHGLAPSYLAHDCVLASAAAGRWHLCCADTMKLLVRRTRTVIGARDLAVSAAVIWNSLPAALRLSYCSVQTFAEKLKTFYASTTMERIWEPFILRFKNSLIIIIIIIIIMARMIRAHCTLFLHETELMHLVVSAVATSCFFAANTHRQNWQHALWIRLWSCLV